MTFKEKGDLYGFITILVLGIYIGLLISDLSNWEFFIGAIAVGISAVFGTAVALNNINENRSNYKINRVFEELKQFEKNKYINNNNIHKVYALFNIKNEFDYLKNAEWSNEEKSIYATFKYISSKKNSKDYLVLLSGINICQEIEGLCERYYKDLFDKEVFNSKFKNKIIYIWRFLFPILLMELFIIETNSNQDVNLVIKEVKKRENTSYKYFIKYIEENVELEKFEIIEIQNKKIVENYYINEDFIQV